MVGFNSSSLTDRQTGWSLVLSPCLLLRSGCSSATWEVEGAKKKGCDWRVKWGMQPTHVFFWGGGVWWKQHVGYPVVGRERFGAIHIPFQTETQGKTINVRVLARTGALRKWRPKVEQQKYAGRCLKWKRIISLATATILLKLCRTKGWNRNPYYIILYIYTCVIFISAFEGLVLSPWRLSGVFFQHPILIHFT